MNHSKSFNNFTLTGRIGFIRARKASNGANYAHISVATGEYYKSKDSQKWETRTTWHNVMWFGKRAETALKIIKKGSLVTINGHLGTQPVDKEGKKFYYPQLIADEVIMLVPGNGESTEEVPAPVEPPVEAAPTEESSSKGDAYDC